MVALGIGLLLYCYYLAFFPFNPVTLGHFKVISHEIKPGEYLEYQLEFTKNMDIKPQVTYYIIDGSIVQLNIGGGASRPLGHQVRNQEILIPLSIRPDMSYLLQIDLVYKVNIFQTKYYSWRSEKFQVVE